MANQKVTDVLILGSHINDNNSLCMQVYFCWWYHSSSKLHSLNFIYRYTLYMCVSGYCFMHIALIWPMMWVPSLPGWICWWYDEMYIKDIKTELCVIGVGKINSVLN